MLGHVHSAQTCNKRKEKGRRGACDVADVQTLFHCHVLRLIQGPGDEKVSGLVFERV